MTPTVTDHAVLRFLERACDVPVEAIRAAIAECCARGAAAGAPYIRIGRVRFVMKGDMVVTTLDKEMLPVHNRPEPKQTEAGA
jgi:hypothetical protein